MLGVFASRVEKDGEEVMCRGRAREEKRLREGKKGRDTSYDTTKNAAWAVLCFGIMALLISLSKDVSLPVSILNTIVYFRAEEVWSKKVMMGMEVRTLHTHFNHIA